MKDFNTEYEWSQENGFKYGQSHDTGNGAMITHGRSQRFPSVIAVRFYSYCRRERNTMHYEIDGDPSRHEFFTAAAAQTAASQIRAIPTACLDRELASRRGR